MNAIWRGTPLVLFDERAAVEPPAHVALIEAVELHHDGPRERGDGNRFLDSCGHVKHAEFQPAKKGMWPALPPHFFSVFRTIYFHARGPANFRTAPPLQ